MKNVLIRVKPNRRKPYCYNPKEVLFVFPKTREPYASDSVQNLMAAMGYGCNQYQILGIEDDNEK
jgi:hypothetical protein